MEMTNSVQLIGHLGGEPQIRETKNGKVARFSIATTEYFLENGTTTTKTEWHNVVAWNSNAQKVEQKCTKGTEVILQGRLTSRSYEDQNKVKRYVTEIVVREIICRQKSEKVSNSVEQ